MENKDTEAVASLKPKRMNQLYLFSSVARPLMTYAVMFILIYLSSIIGYLLITGKENLTAASALLMAIFGALAPIATGLILGRSWEKINNKTISPITDYSGNYYPPVNPQSIDINIGTGDPLDELRQMDLTDFMPRPADDTPNFQGSEQ